MPDSGQRLTPRRETGFTIIELIVAMAIIAVLASIAVPAYRNYILQANRNEAKNLLLDVAAKQEMYFLDNRSYTTTMTNLGYTVDGNGKVDTENDFYKVNIVAATTSCPITNCFVAQAVPQGKQTEDECATLTLSSQGEKDTSSSKTNCW